jgi:isopentenyldiphosphate isomerase
MTDADEIIDLVDDDDNVIGTKSRVQVYKDGDHNIHVVNGFVVNLKGELWIPRRTADKSLFPLGLDVSIGGHIGAGETYEDALKREAAEELNIDLNVTPYLEVGYFNSKEHGVHCFQRVYEIHQDNEPEFNRDDFVEGYWLTPQQLMGKIAEGDTYKDDLPVLVRLLYLNKSKN